MRKGVALMGGDSTTRAVNLTRFLISVPSSKKTFLMLFLISMVLGIFIAFIHSQRSLFSCLLLGSATGIFLLGIPAMLSSVTCYAINRNFKFRRILFLSFVTMLIYGLGYIVYFTLMELSFPYADLVVYLLYGTVFALWFISLLSVFGRSYTALVFSLIQMTYFSLFLIGNNYIDLMGTSSDILFTQVFKLYLASCIFFVSSYLFLQFINAPMKQMFGIKSTEAFNLFMEHWMGESDRLEELFDRIGESVKTWVGAVRFFRSSGEPINIVVPYIHFGPFGSLGGSRYSAELAELLTKEGFGQTVVLHSTTTHDFNPVSRDELKVITETTKSLLSEMEPDSEELSIEVVKSGSATLHVIDDGRSAIFGITRAPDTTEDADFGFGESLMNLMERFRDQAIVFDEHNCDTGKVLSYTVGHRYYWDCRSALERYASLIEENRVIKTRFKVGFGHTNVTGHNIGSAGIKTLVFELMDGAGRKKGAKRSKRKLKKVAFIVIDANGITPGFRRTVIERVKERFGFDLVELISTDTHEVNAVRGVINPITESQLDILYPAIETSLNDALHDMLPASVGMDKAKVDVKVLGTKHAIEIVSTVNAIVAVAKVALPFILLWTVMLIFWAFSSFK